MQQACTVDQQNEIYHRAGLYYELHEDYSHSLDCFSKSGDHYKVSYLLVKNAQKHPGEANFYELEKYYNALPEKGSKNLIEIMTNTYKTMKEKDMIMPSFSVTSCMPSIMNGGKDFSEWSKMDDLLYKTMRAQWRQSLGKTVLA